MPAHHGMLRGFHDDGFAGEKHGIDHFVVDHDIGMGLDPLIADIADGNRTELGLDDALAGAGKAAFHHYGAFAHYAAVLDHAGYIDGSGSVDFQVVAQIPLHFHRAWKGDAPGFQGNVAADLQGLHYFGDAVGYGEFPVA